MTQPHLTWHPRPDNAVITARPGAMLPVTVWLTGLSGAGKSTLAYALESALCMLGHKAYVLDGDNLRHGLNKDLGFSREARRENIRRVAEVAKLFNDAGVIAITAFISPYAEDRRIARQVLGNDRFFEVYLSTSLEQCEKRDPKGLYAKARAGLIPEFTGVSSPYEKPENADVMIDTAEVGLCDCCAHLVSMMTRRYLPGEMDTVSAGDGTKRLWPTIS